MLRLEVFPRSLSVYNIVPILSHHVVPVLQPPREERRPLPPVPARILALLRGISIDLEGM